MKTLIQKYALKLAFAQVVIATLGSLYFSEIANLIPCTLCWYQRICMYPLIIILGLGIKEKKEDIYKYVLPFSVIGWVIGLYHTLIQYGVIVESSNICTAGSCTERYLNQSGFITIPLMSFVAFTVINVLVFAYMIVINRKKK